MNGDAVLAPMRLVILQDRVSVVVGTIVRSPDGPARVALRGDGIQLLGQEVLALHGAQQHGHLGHRWVRASDQGLQRNQRDDPSELLPWR